MESRVSDNQRCFHEVPSAGAINARAPGFRALLPFSLIAILALACSGSDEEQTNELATSTPTRTAIASPTANPTPSLTPTPETYTVVSGDTLAEIAVRFDTTVEELVQRNGIADPSRIEVGQVLVLPPDVDAQATSDTTQTEASLPDTSPQCPTAAQTTYLADVTFIALRAVPIYYDISSLFLDAGDTPILLLSDSWTSSVEFSLGQLLDIADQFRGLSRPTETERIHAEILAFTDDLEQYVKLVQYGVATFDFASLASAIRVQDEGNEHLNRATSLIANFCD